MFPNTQQDSLYGTILAPFLDRLWTTGPRWGRQQALKAPSEQVQFSSDLLGPHRKAPHLPSEVILEGR